VENKDDCALHYRGHMSGIGSVTGWLGELKAGRHGAAQALWERYFARVVGLARKKLQQAPRRAGDEGDVARSAFGSFCQGAAKGRFPGCGDRDGLWALLMVLTIRKAADLKQHEGRQKRGGGRVLAEADLAGAASWTSEPGLQRLVGDEPTPSFAAQVA